MMIRCQIAVVACSVLASSVAVADDAAARQQLADHGLVKFRRFWICPEEAALRSRLAGLARLEPSFFAARDKFQEMVRQYDAYRTRLEKIKAAVAQNAVRLSQTSLGPAQRQQLESENTQHRESMVPLEREINRQLNALDEQSPMTESAIELVAARNALAVSLLAIERRMSEIGPRYADLRRDEQIAAALAGLNQVAALGPAEDYPVLHRRTLSRLADAVFTDGVPIYYRSGQIRLSLIVAESVPVTFSYTGPAGPTIVPAGLLQSAGIAVDSSARETILKEDDRTITARQVTIPRLRIGKMVVRDIAALALPPEAEDLGARISLAALGDYTADLDTKRLWFRLVPLE